MTTLRRHVQSLLDRHGLRAKKRFGQNFLVDGGVLDDIVSAVLRRSPAGLVEIGPGLGVLTQALIGTGLPVVAVERDPDMVAILQTEYGSATNLEIVAQDALRFDFGATPSLERPHIVGNIPYNISSPLLMRLIRQKDRIGDVTLMVQKEVAERWSSAPRKKSYGSPSIMIQAQADVVTVRRVPPQCFLPPPRVDSVVVQLHWLPSPRVPIPDLDHFERVVRAAFSQRRKTLRNSLQTAFPATMLTSVTLDLNRRAETLSLEDMSRLALELLPR